MNRIERKFKELRARGEKALIVYLTAGDPSLHKTEEIIRSLEQAGVDLLEIGVPFSDPIADGPIIQAASQRALKNRVPLAQILRMVASIRRASEIPIILFSYYNPLLAYGQERFAAQAKEAGVDGLLVVDLPLEEAAELRVHSDPLGIDFIPFIAPTTSDERIRQICRDAGGFLYYISITGITGTTRPRVEDIKRDADRIRRITPLPLAVGFGISAPDQVREISPYVDGVVVGSAMVRMIAKNGHRPEWLRIVSDFARCMKQPTICG